MRIGETGSPQELQSAAAEIEAATTQPTAGARPHQPATHLIVDPSSSKRGKFLWDR